MTTLIKYVFRNRNIVINTEFKRFAGHSKWANIRHTKMAKDQEKNTAIRSYILKLRFAIAEGKSAFPNKNTKLAKILEQAKKESVPLTTLKTYLEKMQKSKNQDESLVVESRGPSGCVILIELLAGNIMQTRHRINTYLKKGFFSPNELPNQGSYDQKGIILAEIDNRDCDKNTDDAIEAGAEDVERVKEDDKEFLQFSCHPSELSKIHKKLVEMNYKVIQADLNYIPKMYVSLTEEEMEQVSKLYDKLNSLEEVVKVHTNIL